MALWCLAHRELAWLFHEPHTGKVNCLNMLLSCFRKRMSDLETPVGGLQLVLDHLAVPVRFLRSHGDGVHRVEADVDDDGVVLLDEVLVGGEAHIAVNYLYGGKINALTFSLKLSCFPVYIIKVRSHKLDII